MQRILIIEDHRETREWLAGICRQAFGEPVIEEADTLARAQRLLDHDVPSLALVDLSLPDGSGLRVLERLSRQCPGTYSVVTTIFDDDQHLFRALRAGASGYLLKDQPQSSLVESLVGITGGRPPLSPGVARRILLHFHNSHGDTEPDNPLSEREEEVLTLLAKGLGRGEIADLLDMSVNTAASHTKAIYRKLNVSGRVEATLEATRLGIVNRRDEG
ncbi:MAG: response regulator transcription factor [Pseudomonadota bacterium]|jgi:DNA-binding NarL/FixJ family response regulator|uniref:response regulator n=1 Tax=Alloalcanivorax venustensis TaxID=172371 RepID=UPI002E8AB912|nr:response regulator transcription factor [Pseudomonadota bacterium]MEE3010516.1 response regulator transcription factor [Pseudomonadota bacterium]